jgi:predicted TIM-barrel fold metal-dependent hydrolase
MIPNYPVYDADNHIYESEESFLRHLPKEFANDFFYVERNGKKKLVINGYLSEYIPNPTFDRVAAPGSHERFHRAQNTEGLSFRELQGKPIQTPPEWLNAQGRLELLERQGIYATLLFPTMGSVIEARLGDKPKTIAALFHSLNQWVFEEWTFAYKDRIFPAPFISLSDVDTAIEELDLAISRGARTIGVRPAPIPIIGGSTNFGYPEYDPFWARVCDAGIFVSLHSSDSGYDDIARKWTGGGREYLPFAQGAFAGVLDGLGRAISDAMAALICHGVFERHPKLKVVAVENGAAWVPEFLKRLKKSYGQMPQAYKKHPVDQFHEHVYVAPFYEDHMEELKAHIPVERLVFGSDFPHAEGPAEPLSYLKDFESYSADELHKVFSTNLKGLIEGRPN